MAASSSTQASNTRQFSKMIADKFLEKLAMHQLVPIKSICAISPYKKSNNRKFVKTCYYIVNEEGFNYSIFNGEDVNQSEPNIIFKVKLTDGAYSKFIGEYLHFISYTTDEPFETIIKTLKVPVMDADDLDQYADDLNQICESIDTLVCYYDDSDSD